MAPSWLNQPPAVSKQLFLILQRMYSTVFPSPPGFERNDLFLIQMRHFLEIMTGEATPRRTVEDGIRALELSLAVQRSQQERRLIQISPL